MIDLSNFLSRHGLAVGLACLVLLGAPAADANPSADATTQTVLFACPHNAGKSVIATAYFNALAEKNRLPVRAVSGGTHPSESVSTAVAAMLKEEGLDVSGHKPRLLSPGDLAAADLVVSLGCDDLVSTLPSGLSFESWNDIPSPANELPKSREAIRTRVEELISRFQKK